ncbi:MAG: hypothetical protein HYV02_08420 [Deltaproteobacteria bacterium]|nr:hypothetical protein [Deltaproteobacteria bacterium]
MRRSIIGSLVVLSLATTVACGGSSSGGGTDGDLSDTNSITGTVFAPNGTDPIAGATVYLPSSSSSSLSTPAMVAKTVTVTCSGTSVSCSDPSAAAAVSTCSCADGTFSLDVSSLTSGTTLVIEKGATSKTVSLSCTETTCALGASDTTFSSSGTGALTMAVVTGAYDEIQDVLAKLGYGTLDSATNRLDIGTEQFAIYRGGGSDDSALASISETTYPEASALFGTLATMQQYDIIFINCGADESVSGLSNISVPNSKGLSHAEYHAYHKAFAGSKSVNTTAVTNIQSYVNGGGKIYVTDLAYDFIEQAFPEVMDFQDGGDDDSTTAETADAAQDGTSGIVSDATVNDTEMRTWLSGRATNTIDSSTSPNSGTCTTTTGGSATALNSDNTIRIGDFLPGWAVMDEAYDTSTTVWLQGPVDFSSDAGPVLDEVRPLTVSRTIGSNSGKVLYSSYHTAHSCPTAGFWPQERVLQYLVFEVAE